MSYLDNIDRPKIPVDEVLEHIFTSEFSEFNQEMLALVIDKRSANFNPFEVIFEHMTHSQCEQSLALEIINFLFNYGWDVNGYNLLNEPNDSDAVDISPLMLSILENNVNSLHILLDAGVDINATSPVRGQYKPLIFSIKNNYITIVQQLFKKGLKAPNFETILCFVWENEYHSQIVRLLLRHGSDIDKLLYNSNCTPLTYDHPLIKSRKYKEIIIQEMALMKCDGKLIGSKNFEYMQGHEVYKKMYDDCMEELKRPFYGDVTLYDIFKMKQQFKKFLDFTKNKDFVEAYKSCQKNIYGLELDEIFEEILRKRDILLDEQEKLWGVFKDYIPLVPVLKIAYLCVYDQLYD